jgi:hypothetical protein
MMNPNGDRVRGFGCIPEEDMNIRAVHQNRMEICLLVLARCLVPGCKSSLR